MLRGLPRNQNVFFNECLVGLPRGSLLFGKCCLAGLLVAGNKTSETVFNLLRMFHFFMKKYINYTLEAHQKRTSLLDNRFVIQI